jgi:protein involved in polysaccharide export with SLBB domain
LPRASYLVSRRTVDGVVTLAVGENDPIEPGDTLKVNIVQTRCHERNDLTVGSVGGGQGLQ